MHLHDGHLFILGIIAIVTMGGVMRMWIGARHGIDFEERRERFRNRMQRRWTPPVPGDPDAERKVALLSAENERLTGQISRLEERIAVLERIATDPAERISREIDALR